MKTKIDTKPALVVNTTCVTLEHMDLLLIQSALEQYTEQLKTARTNCPPNALRRINDWIESSIKLVADIRKLPTPKHDSKSFWYKHFITERKMKRTRTQLDTLTN